MEGSDLLFFGVVFFLVYYLTDPTKKNFKKKETGVKSEIMEQKLHQIRMRGIDADRMYVKLIILI